MVFTDIVASTERARQVGDRRWSELLDTHDRVARELVGELQGRLVKSTGDGILALFDRPGRGSAAPPPCATGFGAAGWRSGPGSTPARSSSGATTSAASPSTSRPG